MSTLRNKMATGAMWMVLAKLAERSLGLVSMLILARVLVPQDFGVVAMAMSFVALLEMTSAFGFDTALIQKQTKDRPHWDTAWTFDVLSGTLIALVMLFGANVAASFFNEPRLVAVLWVLAIGSFTQGFQNIGLVAFRSEMQFDREFRFLTIKKLIGFAITVPLAFILDSYWALVIGQTAGRVLSTALSYWVHPYRPRFTLSAAASLMHFSKWMFLLNITHFVKDRSASLVVGRIAGATPLGAFTIAHEVATLPGTELLAPINRAIFPAYAKLAKEGIEHLRREYLSVIGIIVLIATPAALGLAVTSPVLVPVMLGPNWLEAIPVLTLLSLFCCTYIFQSNAQAAYLALGRVNILTWLNGVHAVIQLAALIPLTSLYGLRGAAFAYLLTAVIMIPANLGVIIRILGVSVTSFVRQVWRPIAAATLMYAVVWQFIDHFPQPTTTLEGLPLLIAAIVLGAATYIGAVFALWQLLGRPEGAEKILIDKAFDALRHFGWRKQTLS